MMRVVAVHSHPRHAFSKNTQDEIQLIAGLGVQGDAHAGETVKHRSRVKRDPLQTNLRQVHLIGVELFHELEAKGFKVNPGEIGENITTEGLDLINLSKGTRLHIGQAVIEITGLRNPCYQLDQFKPGLMAAMLDRDATGNLIRKTGVMAIVLANGTIRPNDNIKLELPHKPHLPLSVV